MSSLVYVDIKESNVCPSEIDLSLFRDDLLEFDDREEQDIGVSDPFSSGVSNVAGLSAAKFKSMIFIPGKIMKTE